MNTPGATNKSPWNFREEKITFSLDTREILPDQGLCEKGLEETGRVLFCKTGWRVFLLGKEGAVRSGVDRLRGGDFCLHKLAQKTEEILSWLDSECRGLAGMEQSWRGLMAVPPCNWAAMPLSCFSGMLYCN